MDAKDMLLEDALFIAIEDEKKLICQRGVIAVLIVIIGILVLKKR